MLDNVTINQLRAFVAVCDQGTFSGAARELMRAQSAISHAISALESAFDVLLFERKGFAAPSVDLHREVDECGPRRGNFLTIHKRRRKEREGCEKSHAA